MHTNKREFCSSIERPLVFIRGWSLVLASPRCGTGPGTKWLLSLKYIVRMS